MPHAPIVSGGVIVELQKAEYDKLLRDSERIEIIKRMYANNDYVSTKDIATVLDIKENKEKKE